MSAFKNLLAAGITLGLSDREAFVKKLSGVIEAYQEDSGKADKWAEALAKYLEELKDDIRMQKNIKTAASDNLPQENIEQLTKAVQDLTTELQQQKKG